MFNQGDKMKLLTIILKCYAHQKYFKHAFESALSQVNNKVDLVVYDNGSTQEYAKEIKKACKLNNISLIASNKNNHHTWPFERVIKSLSSKYISILFDDDYYDISRNKYIINTLDCEDNDFIFHDTCIVDKIGNQITNNKIEAVNVESFTNDYDGISGEYCADFLTPPHGARVKYAGLILKLESVLNGKINWDSFHPKINDAIFFTRLLLNNNLKRKYIYQKLTFIRIHGENESLYKKFSILNKLKECHLLVQDENYLFNYILYNSRQKDLLVFLQKRFYIAKNLQIIDALLMSSKACANEKLKFINITYSRSYWAKDCLHRAMELDQFSTISRCKMLTGHDAEEWYKYILQLKEQELLGIAEKIFYARNGFSFEESLNKINSIKQSRSWRYTIPCRFLRDSFSKAIGRE